MSYAIFTTFLAIFFFGTYDVFNRFAVTYIEVGPWIFALLQMAIGSLTLLLISGWKTTGLETLKHWHTWGIGLARVLSATLFIPALAYISATESGLLLKVNIFISVACAALLFNRKPTKTDFIGFILVGLGLWILISHLSNGLATPALWQVIAASACITAATFLAEMHPVSNRVIGVKDRCRYTSVVLFVISFFFLIGSLIATLFSPKLEAFVFNMGNATLSQLLVLSLIAGVFIRAPLTYYNFLSIRLIKSENFLMAMALVPFVSLSFESILGFLGYLDTSMLGGQVIIGALFISIGSFFSVAVRILRKQIK